MSLVRVGTLLAVVLLGAAAGQGVPGAASAAGGYCAKGTGVTVVVDAGTLGGGTSIGCDSRGAGVVATTVVPRAGFPLTYVTGSSFVCRVSGKPASASCGHTPPSNAYWGLFWANGKGGGWTYASTGAGSLKVPAGGFVGWRWQSGSRTVPGTAPVAPKAAPSGTPPAPRPSASHHPAPQPSAGRRHATSPAPGRPASGPSRPSSARSAAGGTTSGRATGSTAPRSGGASASAGAAARTGASRSAKASARATATAPATASGKASGTSSAQASERASASATASRTAAAGPGSSPSASPSSGVSLTSGEQASGSGPLLPVVAAGLLVVLLAAAGVLAWRRRAS